MVLPASPHASRDAAGTFAVLRNKIAQPDVDQHHMRILRRPARHRPRTAFYIRIVIDELQLAVVRIGPQRGDEPDGPLLIRTVVGVGRPGKSESHASEPGNA